MTITEERADLGTGAAQQTTPLRPAGRRSFTSYLFMPAVLGAVLLVLWWWISGKELDTRERARLNSDYLITATLEHLHLTVVATAIVIVIAIPLGILLTRPSLGAITRPSIAVFSIGVALPSIGILVLFAVVWDIGFWPVVVALVIYTVLPVMRNTMVGLQQVDPAVIEAARGMGMTHRGVLARIELPLAVPVTMAGIRTALVIMVGTAALGTFVGAGGLGGLIVAGIGGGRPTITLVGGVLIAVLALLVDYVAGIAEDLLRPKGL
jgi:osmoprotectant transport system permease protein